jgi:hypothetical protein
MWFLIRTDRSWMSGGTANLNNYPRSPPEHTVPADTLHRHFESATIAAQVGHTSLFIKKKKRKKVAHHSL